MRKYSSFVQYLARFRINFKFLQHVSVNLILYTYLKNLWKIIKNVTKAESDEGTAFVILNKNPKELLYFQILFIFRRSHSIHFFKAFTEITRVAHANHIGNLRNIIFARF